MTLPPPITSQSNESIFTKVSDETPEILIKPSELADVPDIVALRNDPSTLLRLHDANQYNIAQTEHWLAHLPPSSKRYSVFLRTISPSEPRERDAFVGLVRIDRIDWPSRNCMVGLDLVPEQRGKGLSKRVYAWLLDYLFGQLNFHMVYLEVLESNEPAIRLYRRLGFKEDGRLRERVFRRGAYEDSLLMSLLRSEYQS